MAILKEFKNKESIDYLKEQSQNKDLCIYCKGGVRSLEATLILDQSNIRSTNIVGGILAWAEEIEKRKDGRILNQDIGFAYDNAIRAWEFPTGIAPMRRCSCNVCMLHGRRRAEYLMCSITQGRHNTYDVKKLLRLFEREGLDRFVPDGELESRIVEATRNKSVFLSRPEADLFGKCCRSKSTNRRRSWNQIPCV